MKIFYRSYVGKTRFCGNNKESRVDNGIQSFVHQVHFEKKEQYFKFRCHLPSNVTLSGKFSIFYL